MKIDSTGEGGLKKVKKFRNLPRGIDRNQLRGGLGLGKVLCMSYAERGSTRLWGGPGAKPLVGGSGGRSPPEAERLLLLSE